jgi:hypothetical protein
MTTANGRKPKAATFPQPPSPRICKPSPTANSIQSVPNYTQSSKSAGCAENRKLTSCAPRTDVISWSNSRTNVELHISSVMLRTQ